MLLLDTCVLLWLEIDRGRLPAGVLKLLVEHDVDRHVSPISAFEIAWKAKRGRLQLAMPPAEWFAGMVERYALQQAALDWRIAVRAAELDLPHGDPCDRVIAATAAVHGFTLLTPDEHFARCTGVRVAW